MSKRCPIGYSVKKSRFEEYIPLFEGKIVRIQIYDQFLHNNKATEYQPSGKGGARSPPAPPAKSKMATRGPQKGVWGLERCLPLGFWAF